MSIVDNITLQSKLLLLALVHCQLNVLLRPNVTYLFTNTGKSVQKFNCVTYKWIDIWCKLFVPHCRNLKNELYEAYVIKIILIKKCMDIKKHDLQRKSMCKRKRILEQNMGAITGLLANMWIKIPWLSLAGSQNLPLSPWLSFHIFRKRSKDNGL